MSPLKPPRTIPAIKARLDSVKHSAYNLLYTVKQKSVVAEAAKNTGKEGPETDTALLANHDKLYNDHSVTPAELEKYRKL